MSQRDKDIRVSDAERDAVVRALGEHASVGRLTLDEFEDRSSRALEAKTRGELDALTADLPDADSPAAEPEVRHRGRVRWLVSILGIVTHTAMSRAVGMINAIWILDEGEIDLRNVEIEGGELTINSFALLCSPDIFVPDTIEVDAGGISILGGLNEHGTARSPRPGAPVVKLRSFGLLGGATLYRVPAKMRGRTTREIRKSMRHEHEIGGSGHGRGPLGPGGPLGPDGPLGPRGLLGPDGPLGPRGPLGPDGPLGPHGPLGPRGPLGGFGHGRGGRGPFGEEPDED